jgi:hypothetical protein
MKHVCFLILFCGVMTGMAFTSGHKNKPRIAIAGLHWIRR